MFEENEQLKMLVREIEQQAKQVEVQLRGRTEEGEEMGREVTRLNEVLEAMRQEMRAQAESCKRANAFLRDKFEILRERLVGEFKQNLG
jgi:hypothetical protein